jgi:chromatin remodeling complex protein RSC6
MPKKTVSKTETEIVAPAPVVDVAAPVAAAEKKTRKPKAVKTEAVVETAPAPAVETAPVTTDAAVAADVEAPLAEQSVEFVAKLQQLGALINSIKSEYKALEKKWSREVKAAQKQSSKRKRKAGNRAPSGFVKPTKISDELAAFLGKEKGAEMARTDVTREINTYIRAQKLQDSTNGRKINPDKKLAALLKLKTTDELTYFNLQKYMSPHFAKAAKEGVVA